ncbi:MAG: hypothetical protein IKZ25_05840 [Clostridia bacterium]|nr:hypothetical protein [Clostridia bacterium]
MKKYISLLLVLLILTNCLAGCSVKPSGGPGATGESSPETTTETSLENSSEVVNDNISQVEIPQDNKEDIEESTLEWVGPQDNYPIEYLDFDYDKYPQLKGFIKVTDPYQLTPFSNAVTEKELLNQPKGIFVKNNHVLAKVNKVEKLKINNRYFLKYEYEIEKVYYGNLKKGDKVNAYMKDWTEKQEHIYLGQVLPYYEGYKISVAYPQVGQYIITRIHSYDFDENYYPTIKERYYKYYNEILYKNELKIMEENYFINSEIFAQFVFDKDKNLVSAGAGVLEMFKKFKNNEKATIEKLSDVDGFIEYLFIYREENPTNEQ